MVASPTLSADTGACVRRRVIVRGAVQGIGFRPFVYRQATALGLGGWVMNTSEGVSIEVEGDAHGIEMLLEQIQRSPPPNALISGLRAEPVALRGENGFAIRASTQTALRTALAPPDIATCQDCLNELLDPANRRHRYPFTTCAQCGPRYSIIESLPYDRTRTTMRSFAPCELCRQEYEDPGDRRFHAEAIACPQCGPQLALWDGTGTIRAERDEALEQTAAALRQGAIVAMKGLGGFQLLVDARNAAAVGRLRDRKQRPDKPLAVMFSTLAQVAALCRISLAEEQILTSPRQPIVLLRQCAAARDVIAPNVAPGSPDLGAMLAYTPLHHLLMRELDFPLVATSGNVSDAPIISDEGEALSRLGPIADLLLVHDRPIAHAIDDSVVRLIGGREAVLRRARGHSPAAFPLSRTPPGILALGGHQKSTVAVTIPDAVVLGPHIGDLDSSEARDTYARSIHDMTCLHGAHLRLVACDLHPDYHSTRVARDAGVPVVTVQHHVAHIAACMAEHGLRPPLLGVAWDGTGYGSDGSIWGGEFLRITEVGFQRVAHLRPFALPGPTAAAREPWRSAVGVLHALFGAEAFALDQLAPIRGLPPTERIIVRAMLERSINVLLTSSAGRLFDAAAALIGLRQRTSYEGQAAAELEWLAGSEAAPRCYDFAIRASAGETELVVDWEPAMRTLIDDVQGGRAAPLVSQAFHHGLATAISAVAKRVGERQIVLTGGCFQNAFLSNSTIASLQRAGLSVYWHQQAPPNDGGLALGQAAWAARFAAQEHASCV